MLTLTEAEIIETKTKLSLWNNAYRDGVPIVSDSQFDIDLIKFEKVMTSLRREAEFLAFKNSLTEKAGAVNHDFIAGSLENMYPAFDGEEQNTKKRVFSHWCSSVADTELFISAKIDGMSCLSKHLKNQHSAATRGDGYSGEKICQNLSNTMFKSVDSSQPLQVRSELTLTGDSHKTLGYKNRRNGTVGVVKKLDATIEEQSHIRAYAYQILGETSLSRYQQFEKLQKIGFAVPKHILVPKEQATDAYMLTLLKTWRAEAEYSIDGLVVCGKSYTCENSKLPEKMVAFKSFGEAVKTRVIDIQITPSMNGRLAPVLIVEPVEIDGTTVQRVNAYNMNTVMKQNLGPGAVIEIRKAGEVIPELCRVLEPAVSTPVLACPECSASVDLVGEDAYCSNASCATRELKQVEYFLRAMGIDGASRVSLEKWGITNFDALLQFRPASSGSRENQLYDDFVSKVLCSSDVVKILSSLPFVGIAEKTITKLVEHFGSIDKLAQVIASNPELLTEVPTIREKTAQKVLDAFDTSYAIYSKILQDPRRVVTDTVTVDTSALPLNQKSVLVTGTLSVGRKEFQELIKSLGGKVEAGISKSLDILVVGDDAGSKLDKAKAIPSIQIMTEQDFRDEYSAPSIQTAKRAVSL